MKEVLVQAITKSLESLGISDIAIQLDHPADPKHGDYATNVALIAAKKLGKSPREVAEALAKSIEQSTKDGGIERVEIAGPGFINFFMSKEYLLTELQDILKNDKKEISGVLNGKKIMVEYAHPNTHKEMHIGHMRTLITGEAIARLLEANGATVFRANYQGDIGPHVAKALWGIEQLMRERNLSLDEVSTWSHSDKAHFLGEGYAKGSQEYDAQKEDIDTLNSKLYQRDESVMPLYELTRQWSLDYYQDFYERFYTQFDRLFFESTMVESGKKIVTDNIGKVFKEANGAVIFPGEEYGLHTRVFITQAGNPTYEGKEMGNGFAEWDAFPFDMKIHVVASEQAGYFQVVFKALELIDPEKFKDKQHHVSMGMVTLTDRKMSSRTGDVLTVDWLLDEVKKKVNELFSGDRVSESEKDEIAEAVTIAAVKHSVLRVSTTQNVAFSIDKSVSLDGDSGPYLQYTYVRAKSVLSKGERAKGNKFAINEMKDYTFASGELALLRKLALFTEAVENAAHRYNPSILATYLFELAQEFNLFYQKLPILKEEGKRRELRLALTDAVGKKIRHGLDLLGIKTPEKM